MIQTQDSSNIDIEVQDGGNNRYMIVQSFEIDESAEATQTQRQSRKLQLMKVLSNRNYWSILMLIIATILYQAALEECPYVTDSQCSQMFLLPRIPTLVLEGLSSSLIFTVIIFFGIYKLISKYIFLFEIVLLGYQLLFQGHTLSTTNYQLIFQVFLIMFIFLHSLIIMSLILGYKFFRKFGKYALLFSILVILILTQQYYSVTKNSCSQWKNGINENISDDSAYCAIQQPEVCWFDILDGLMDASKLSDCTKNAKVEKDLWLSGIQKYVNITNETRYLEMPRTEQFAPSDMFKSHDEYQTYVLSQIKQRATIQEISPNSESYFDIENMKYVTKIKRNETLVNERNATFNNHDKKPKNIIVIWIDAVARTRFMKKLPKSMKWLKEQSKDKILYEGLRYLSVGTHTSPAYFGYEYTGDVTFSKSVYEQMSYSLTEKSHQAEQNIKTSLSEKIKDQGYIIGRARTQCGSSVPEYVPQHQEYLKLQPTDHELIVPSCDPNYQNPQSPFNIFQGPYSILRKCLYGQEFNKYVFDYAKDFLTTYSTEPKYLELYFTDGHEGTGETIQYFDEPLAKFLQWLSDDNHLDNSVFSVQSDHGLHMQGLYYVMGIEMYHTELALPGVFMLVDKRLLNDTQQIQLRKNQQKLITIYEISYFIRFLIEPSQYNQDNSLISTLIPEKRSCAQTAKPSDQFCPCL